MDEEILFNDPDVVDPENGPINQETLPEISNNEPSNDSSSSTESDPTSNASEQDTMLALRDLLRQSVETKAELAETRNLVRKIIDSELTSANRASEDDFIRQAKEHYQSDPFQGAAMLVGKARDDLVKLMDQKIYEAFGAREQFNRLMDDFLDDPSHHSLKSFRNELEFLIRDRGVEPREAASFLKAIEGKARKAAIQKTETMREVRNRATTEQVSRPLETPDQDRELTRAFKQARNLDEMFAALKKTRM
ncbi:MAG: hypothetical protein M1511_16695 [Deltaproteobacteria bacterium]|nr:hypothetical protein [Deltaproteobacteria bacterium]